MIGAPQRGERERRAAEGDEMTGSQAAFVAHG